MYQPAPPPSAAAPAYAPVAAPAVQGGDMVAVDDLPPGDAAPTIDAFYQPLAVHGRWEDHPRYGRAWSPYDVQYEPYVKGYWQATTYGWAWIADEPFGWAVNHYGRWTFDGRWLWIPDTTWGPSWVDWRTGGDYIGWAPAAPTGAGAVPGARWKFIAAVDLGRVDLVNSYVAIDVGVAYDASQPLERYTRTPRGEVFVAGPDPVVLRERYSTDVAPAALPASMTGRFESQAWRDPNVLERQRRSADTQQRMQDRQRIAVQRTRRPLQARQPRTLAGQPQATPQPPRYPPQPGGLPANQPPPRYPPQPGGLPANQPPPRYPQQPVGQAVNQPPPRYPTQPGRPPANQLPPRYPPQPAGQAANPRQQQQQRQAEQRQLQQQRQAEQRQLQQQHQAEQRQLQQQRQADLRQQQLQRRNVPQPPPRRPTPSPPAPPPPRN
jgi:hypothetical protein